MKKYMDLDSFKELTKKSKIDYLMDIFEKFDIKITLSKLKLSNVKSYNDFYEKCLEFLLREEPLTDEIILKLVEKKEENQEKIQEENQEKIQQEVEIVPKKFVLKYKNVGKKKYILKKATDNSVGYDLYLDRCITDEELGLNLENIHLLPFQSKKYGTGIAIELPKGFHAEIVPRSSLFRKNCQVLLTNSIGIIDNDYRGEIIVQLTNNSNLAAFGPPIGTRIAQLIIRQSVVMETEETDELSETKRNTGGFGSTGE